MQSSWGKGKALRQQTRTNYKRCRDRQKVTPEECTKRDRPQHETVATKYHEQRKEKLDKTRKPRIKIERKRARNRPLLCQMPCSDRGIRREKESHAQHRHRLQNRDQNGIKVEEPALGGGWVEDIESRKNEAGINGLSARMSILPPLSGCSWSRVGHCSTQEQERPDSRPVGWYREKKSR